jgi:hypothetical protein
MHNQLNSKYFSELGHTYGGEYMFYTYRPKGNPMVLFSNIDGTPLASVHVMCQESQTGRALITKRQSGDTDFQALIDRDHQEFQFIITNLTGEGMIKIDIMKNDGKVTDVDPGTEKGAVNKVNELHEYQSYAVKCDQKDNFSFILDTIRTNDNSHITVQEAESKQESKIAKYWISVVAEAGKPDLVSKFIETFWSTPDVIVIRKKGGRLIEKGSNFRDEGMSELCSMPRSYSHNESAYNNYMMPESSFRVYEPVNPIPPSDAIPKGMSNVPLISPKMDTIVNNSSAATVRGGRQMTVNSNVTNKTYAFDNHSIKCTLGLSVAEGLKFRDPPAREELKEIGNVIIEHYMKDTLNLYLSHLNTIYTSEECVICMDGKPDSVIYSCGHQCCHYDCISKEIKCPLCRNHITANIKL